MERHPCHGCCCLPRPADPDRWGSGGLEFDSLALGPGLDLPRDMFTIMFTRQVTADLFSHGATIYMRILLHEGRGVTVALPTLYDVLVPTIAVYVHVITRLPLSPPCN